MEAGTLSLALALVFYFAGRFLVDVFAVLESVAPAVVSPVSPRTAVVPAAEAALGAGSRS